MPRLDKLKNQLEISNQKAKDARENGPDHIYNWYEGFTDGLERAIEILEEED